MAIEKKSLISTLKTTKKANVISSAPSHEATHTVNKFAAKRPTKAVAKMAVKSVNKMAVKTLSKKMTD